MKNFEKDHWDKIYNSSDISKLGWYEARPEQSLALIQKCSLGPNDLILDAGAGASTLVDHLIYAGYNRIIANDISSNALQKAQNRLGADSEKIKWIVEDITQSVEIRKLSNIALWHDRAVLHFLTRKVQQEAYFKTLDAVVKVNGFVIIATFSLSGAKKCSGLDIVNYDEIMIAKQLGKKYKLLDAFDHIYTTPGGETRPYIYTRFQKTD